MVAEHGLALWIMDFLAFVATIDILVIFFFWQQNNMEILSTSKSQLQVRIYQAKFCRLWMPITLAKLPCKQSIICWICTNFSIICRIFSGTWRYKLLQNNFICYVCFGCHIFAKRNIMFLDIILAAHFIT